MIIQTDLDTQYRDSGIWRGYQLYAKGECADELINTAVISEIDQDGGEITSYGFHDADDEIKAECFNVFAAALLKFAQTQTHKEKNDDSKRPDVLTHGRSSGTGTSKEPT